MGNSLRYFLNQIQVLATYLRMLIWPAGLTIDHDFQPFSVVSLYAFGCYLLLSCILLSAVLTRRRNPMIAFLVMVFLLFLAPTSSFIPSADLLFEHRLYLPMIAASILMAWAFFLAGALIIKTEARRQVISLVCLGLLLTGFGICSWKRTSIWGDGVRLWQDATAKAPRKPRAHYNLASAYLDRDRQMARTEFLKTIELDPKHAAALYNLGWLEQTEGAYDMARGYYLAAVEADSGSWQAHQNLGNLDILQGSIHEAIGEFQTSIRLRADYWPAYQSLAALQLQTGDAKSALETLQRLQELRWDLLEARYLKACALVEEGRTAEAEAELRFVANRDPGGAYRDRIASLHNKRLSQPRISR